MKHRLLIVGAGYTGSRIVEQAADAGWDVAATTRSEPRRRELGELGAQVLAWSAEDGIAGLPLDDSPDVVYSVPPTDAITPADIVEIARRSGRFVYLSSTSVYGNYEEGEVDEESPRRPTSPAGKARLEIEDALLASGLDAQIVRIVGIYGPGRTLDRYLAGGRYKLVDGGQKLTNRIHVDDLARVVLAVVERAADGPCAYIAADGHPVRVRDLVDWLIANQGIDRPPEVTLEQYRAERGDDAAERWANSYTANNHRIREDLGVRLQFPDVYAGYAAIFAAAPGVGSSETSG